MLPEIVVRHDWLREEIQPLFKLPFNDLIYLAQFVHRQCFRSNAVQISSLLNVKTGVCPEDCAYCPQSGHYHTGLKKERAVAVFTTSKISSAGG